MKKLLNWLFWPKVKLSKLLHIENIILIILNLLPIIGVLFLDWKAIPILLLYYVEIVIGFIFQIILINRQDTDSYPSYIPKTISHIIMFLPITVLLLIPLIFVLFASGEELIWQSVSNIYFWIFILFYLGNEIKLLIKITKAVKQDKKSKFPSVFTSLKMIFGPYVILALVLIIYTTKEYQSLLILIILIKTFLDIRSYLRKQTQLLPENNYSKT
jgi:hypothetical protein